MIAWSIDRSKTRETQPNFTKIPLPWKVWNRGGRWVSIRKTAPLSRSRTRDSHYKHHIPWTVTSLKLLREENILVYHLQGSSVDEAHAYHQRQSHMETRLFESYPRPMHTISKGNSILHPDRVSDRVCFFSVGPQPCHTHQRSWAVTTKNCQVRIQQLSWHLPRVCNQAPSPTLMGFSPA